VRTHWTNALDRAVALAALIVTLPLLIAVAAVIWLSDFGPPFYLAVRIGKDGRKFKMLKLRSMVVNSDSREMVFTTADDPRITPLGRWLRATKLDELAQLWNVVRGDMSLVGPRPQPEAEVNYYSEEEWRLLSVRPGLTDIATLIFADESEILRGRLDAEQFYWGTLQLWKKRFALLHLDHRTLRLDMKVILLTIAGLLSRRTTLDGVLSILRDCKASGVLLRVARRNGPVLPYPFPQLTSQAQENVLIRRSGLLLRGQS
jgi:lipopolysaccharide/colanic/teichoic acid biosynthesis glycosyltransferase